MLHKVPLFKPIALENENPHGVGAVGMGGGVIRLLSSLFSWKENGTNKFSTVQKYPSPLRRIRDEKMDISFKDIKKEHGRAVSKCQREGEMSVSPMGAATCMADL